MIFNHSVPILYSSDIRRSLNFYTEVFGFDSKWEWDDPPGFGGVSKDVVDIFFCKECQGNPGTWISIMVDNVDELYDRIQSKGGKIVCDPENREWGLREMIAEDPDGHKIRFGQNAPRSGRQKSGALPENIRIVERVPTIKEYQQLVSSVDWLSKPEAIVQKILAAPVFASVAEDTDSGKVVGCVLLMGDHSSFFYIKDMMVEPTWQSKRVGTALMQSIHQWIEKNAPDDALVGLYTGENLAPFYRQFGFKPAFGMCRRIGKKGGM